VSNTLDTWRAVKDVCHVRNDVRQLREDQALSQGQLAGLLGVSRQTVNAIETGRYDPSLPLALRIARLFGLYVEEIFHDDAAPVVRPRSRRAR
jgi:putative transcriptional regulator